MSTSMGYRSIKKWPEGERPKEFDRLKAIGDAKISQIKAAFELGRRLFEEHQAKGPAFLSGYNVLIYYRLQAEMI